MKYKTAVITGASDGIGRSFSKLLVNLGWEKYDVKSDFAKVDFIG